MKRFEVKESTRNLNELRIKLNKNSLPIPKFRETLKAHKLPHGTVFWTFLIRYRVLTKTGEGYSFVNPEHPIHYSVLENILSSYWNKLKEYDENRKGIQRVDEKATQRAIEFLKSQGYVIYKPI